MGRYFFPYEREFEALHATNHFICCHLVLDELMKCIPRKKWFEVYTCHIDATMSENILSWGTLIDLKFHIITVHQLCYILICLSTLHTQHTTFFSYSIIQILATVCVHVPVKIQKCTC